MPRYANPAVNFATDDMGSDEAMGGVLLDILIVIIAFIFAVTISNTIAKESQTIGTLRASGYTKGELVRHYLAMPVLVTMIAAVVGNLLGYTVFKDVVVSMYYNSYSLPAYETIWNPDAFIKTTVIPVFLMLAVNLIVIIYMMQHTPLQFLRRDLKKQDGRKRYGCRSGSSSADSVCVSYFRTCQIMLFFLQVFSLLWLCWQWRSECRLR